MRLRQRPRVARDHDTMIDFLAAAAGYHADGLNYSGVDRHVARELGIAGSI
jgi:hypothetical protein